MCATMHVERPEDNLQEPILSFHHVGPGDEIWVARFVSKHLYTLKYLAASHRFLIKGSSNGRQTALSTNGAGETGYPGRKGLGRESGTSL